MSENAIILIRNATPADAGVIALLGRITFTETFGHLFRYSEDLDNYLKRTFSVDKIESSLKKAENVYWLAFANRLPVGYAKLKLDSPSLFLNESSICQLQKIYVLKDFLSLKIGLALQQELLRKAGDLEFSTIWLSVLKENERAIRFYHKNGFEKIGDHDFSIGREDFKFIAMAKGLT